MNDKDMIEIEILTADWYYICTGTGCNFEDG